MRNIIVCWNAELRTDRDRISRISFVLNASFYRNNRNKQLY